MMRACLVLPAYNEAGNLAPLIDATMASAAAAGLSLSVLVVNDGSADDTASELAELAARFDTLRVVTHERNMGFAATLKDGIAAARRFPADVFVFMDSDLSHAPEDVPRLIAALDNRADVALGSRFVRGGGMAGVPWWRRLISRAGNFLGRIVLGLPIRDLTTGYRAFRRDALERITLTEDSFAIQLEAIVKACAAGSVVVEVPIILGTRRHGVSHMNYSGALFARYFRLLLKCRRWLSEGRAVARHAAERS